MCSINQKDYLKKYLKIGKKLGEKKKKKKTSGKGLKIIDDDADAILSREIEDDLNAANEDAPQIVAVIDERPPSMRVDEKTKSNLWQPIGGTINSSSDFQSIQLNKSIDAIDLKKNKLKLTSVSSKTNNSLQKSSEDDIYDHSPLRKNTNDYSPPRKNTNDYSPPRKNNRKEDVYSPKGNENEDNLSAKRRDKSSNDYSPPRKKTNDYSPPRKNNRKKDYDYSLKRKDNEDNLIAKQRDNSTDDYSPPRKNNRKKDDDYSPKRKKNEDNLTAKQRDTCNKDFSPIRKRDADYSPSRRSNKDSSHSRKRDHSMEKDYSPSRKTNLELRQKNRDSSIRKKKSRWEDDSPLDSKPEMTMSGKKSGLQSAQNLVKDMARLQSQEADMFKTMSAEASGKNATTVIRRKKEDNIDPQKDAREKELKEKYSVWGRGIKQVQDENEKFVDQQREMNKPLARYADDEDLERHLKEQEREGDPMLAYVRKKKKKTAVEQGIPEKPTYMGDFMPNRFAIRPGYRWDGVDRSNGYENKWFQAQNSKKALQEEALKWSTEDM